MLLWTFNHRKQPNKCGSYLVIVKNHYGLWCLLSRLELPPVKIHADGQERFSLQSCSASLNTTFDANFQLAENIHVHDANCSTLYLRRWQVAKMRHYRNQQFLKAAAAYISALLRKRICESQLLLLKWHCPPLIIAFYKLGQRTATAIPGRTRQNRIWQAGQQKRKMAASRA